MSTGVGTIAVRTGGGRRRWMLRVVISVVAVAVAALSFAGIRSLTSAEPVGGQPSGVLPKFEGGPVHAGSWEDRHPVYGGFSDGPAVHQPVSGYARTFEQTGGQRG